MAIPDARIGELWRNAHKYGEALVRELIIKVIEERATYYDQRIHLHRMVGQAVVMTMSAERAALSDFGIDAKGYAEYLKLVADTKDKP